MIHRAFALALSFAMTTEVLAERENIENVDQSFIGILDLEARYGGYEEWVRAAWGSEDPELEFKLSEGRPFDSEAKRLKATQFTMLETGYEYPSVLVYRRIDDPRLSDWIQVLIDDKPQWIQMEGGDVFEPYPHLFDEGRLGYFLDRDIMISDHPGGKRTRRTFVPADQNTTGNEYWTPEVSVIGRATLTLLDENTGNRSAQDWLKIRVKNQPSCEGILDKPETVAEGWIPTHRADGDISVWFYSRGC